MKIDLVHIWQIKCRWYSYISLFYVLYLCFSKLPPSLLSAIGHFWPSIIASSRSSALRFLFPHRLSFSCLYCCLKISLFSRTSLACSDLLLAQNPCFRPINNRAIHFHWQASHQYSCFKCVIWIVPFPSTIPSDKSAFACCRKISQSW